MRIVVGLLLVGAMLAGCADEAIRSAERFKARQRAVDPLQLWSIEVTWPEQTAPITICTDKFVRDGFLRPLPSQDGKQCALLEQPTVMPDRIVMRCTLNDHNMMVRSKISGDLSRDYTVDYALQGPMPTARQVRRHRYLGPCPAGWDIGDNTDRAGRLHKNALH